MSPREEAAIVAVVVLLLAALGLVLSRELIHTGALHVRDRSHAAQSAARAVAARSSGARTRARAEACAGRPRQGLSCHVAGSTACDVAALWSLLPYEPRCA